MRNILPSLDVAVPIHPGDILTVLCEDNYLMKWLQLERESCIAGVEYLLSSEECWKNRYQSFSDIDMVPPYVLIILLLAN